MPRWGLCGCFSSDAEEVRELDYRHNSLADVPGEVFTFERTLEELHLDANQISDLPVSLFHCHSLRYLGLSDNELQTLPPAVASLIHLHVLDVSKNAITTIPDNINGCKQLRSVDASVNPLSRLPDGFTQLISLQELYLSDTFLEYLPANFGRLSRLRILELRENRLTSLPKSMSRLTHLQRLDLGQNDLSELPEVVGSLTGLTELLCDFNKMSCLPPLLGQLTRLTHLDASNNKLRELPEELGRCTQLGYLQLSANNLRTIPESCGSLTRLVTLKLDDNTLTSLPERLGQMAALQELNTSHNNLTRLPGSVGLLRALTDLNVDENLLQELPHELGSCVSLRVLSVRANRLIGVPAELGHLWLLRVLNLCSNRIAHLPCSFSKLHNLQALWLSPNQNTPLVQLQSETAARGQKVLTCFMLPQQSDPDYSEMPDRHDTLQLRPQQLAALEADLAARSHIKFAVERASEPLTPGRLLRAPTPYPKELKELAKHARNLQKLGRRPDQPPPPPPPSAQAGDTEKKPSKESESKGSESPVQSPPADALTPENVSGELPDWGSWDGPDTKEEFVDGDSPEPPPAEPVTGSSSQAAAVATAEDSDGPQPGGGTPVASSDVPSGTAAVSAAVTSTGVAPPQGTSSRPWLPPAVGCPPPYHVAASQSRLAGEFAYRRMDPLRLLNTSLDVPAGQIPPPARLNETFDLADLRNTGTSWQHTPSNGSAHPLGNPSGMNGISRVPIEGPTRPEEPRPGGSPTKPRRASSSRASGRFPRRSDEKLPAAGDDTLRAEERPLLRNGSQAGAGGSPPGLGNEPPKLLGNPPRPLRLESEESVSGTDALTGNTAQEGPKVPETGPSGDAAGFGRVEDVSDKASAGAAVDVGPGGNLREGVHIVDTGSDGEAAGLLSTISQITDYDSSTSDSAAEPPPPPLPPPAGQRREPLRAPLASRIPRRQDSPGRQESPVRSENAAAAPVERGRTLHRQESPPPPPLPPPQGDGPPAGRHWQAEREPRVPQSSQLPVRVTSPPQQPAGGQPPALPARQKPADAPGVLPLSREGSRSFLPMPRSRLESPQRANGSPSGQTPARVQAPAIRTPTTQTAVSAPAERVREPSFSQLPVPRSRHASPHQTNGVARPARPAAGSHGMVSAPVHQEGSRRGQLYSTAPSSSQLPVLVDSAVSVLPRLAAPRQSPAAAAAGSRGSLSASDGAGPAGSRRSVSSTVSTSSSRIPVARAGAAVHPVPVAAPRHGWPPSSFAASDAAYTQVDVTIEKNPGLGFSIAGGSGSDTSHKGVYISRVQADGGAWQLLRPGDRLVAVDGADLSAASHAQAVQALLHTDRAVQLRLLRPAQQ